MSELPSIDEEARQDAPPVTDRPSAVKPPRRWPGFGMSHREQFNHNAINRYPRGERVALYGRGSHNWGHMRSVHPVNPIALPWQSTSRHYPNSAMALTVIL